MNVHIFSKRENVLCGFIKTDKLLFMRLLITKYKKEYKETSADKQSGFKRNCIALRCVLNLCWPETLATYRYLWRFNHRGVFRVVPLEGIFDGIFSLFPVLKPVSGYFTLFNTGFFDSRCFIFVLECRFLPDPFWFQKFFQQSNKIKLYY